MHASTSNSHWNQPVAHLSHDNPAIRTACNSCTDCRQLRLPIRTDLVCTVPFETVFPRVFNEADAPIVTTSGLSAPKLFRRFFEALSDEEAARTSDHVGGV